MMWESFFFNASETAAAASGKELAAAKTLRKSVSAPSIPWAEEPKRAVSVNLSIWKKVRKRGWCIRLGISRPRACKWEGSSRPVMV